MFRSLAWQKRQPSNAIPKRRGGGLKEFDLRQTLLKVCPSFLRSYTSKGGCSLSPYELLSILVSLRVVIGVP